jgi:hypothetical protein
MADESKPPHVPSDPKDATALFFDRLDAAFSKLNTSRRAASPPPSPAPPPVAAAVPSGLVADAFSALLALEDGEPGAKPVRLTTAGGDPAPVEIPDAVIEDIARRVAVHLGPDAIRAVVADVVSDIAERLVREEIDRLRKPHV